MICPKCNQESINFEVCPYCNYDFSTIPNELDKKENLIKLKKRLNVFYVSVIVVGIIVFALLVINLLNKGKKTVYQSKYTNDTTTTSVEVLDYTPSNPIEPVKMDVLTLGSIKDGDNYYDAYIKGVRLINSEEAINILNQHGITYELSEGFYLEGLVYNVSIKDNLNISPVLNSNFYYTETGNDYVNINENIFRIDTVDIYDGDNLTNSNNKDVVVIYQTNTNNYSICMGYRKHNIGCINPTNSS